MAGLPALPVTLEEPHNAFRHVRPVAADLHAEWMRFRQRATARQKPTNLQRSAGLPPRLELAHLPVTGMVSTTRIRSGGRTAGIQVQHRHPNALGLYSFLPRVVTVTVGAASCGEAGWHRTGMWSRAAASAISSLIVRTRFGVRTRCRNGRQLPNPHTTPQATNRAPGGRANRRLDDTKRVSLNEPSHPFCR
jgi:hypothetical protein